MSVFAPEDRPLELDLIFRRAWSTLWDNPLYFFGLMAVASLPGFFLQMLGAGTLVTLVNMFLGLTAQGAIAYGVFQSFQGQDYSLGEALPLVLRHIGLLALAALLMSLGIGLGLLLIVPGLILCCAWAVTIQACLIERLGPLEAIKRSMELTQGQRRRIFLLFLLVGLAAVVGGAIFSFLVASLFGFGKASIVLSVIFMNCLIGTFWNILVSVIYYDLRSIKEGLTVESLAGVFD